MSLRRRLLAYLLVVHTVFLALAFHSYLAEPLLLVCIEAGLLLSLTLGIYLVKTALQPLEFAHQFHELLQDENYAARLRSGSNTEVNQLVQLFNHMLEALYLERLKLGEQRGFLDRLLEATPTAVVVFDFDQHISLMNASAQRLLGLSDVEGHSLQQLLNNSQTPQGIAWAVTLDSLAVGETTVYSDIEGRRYRCQKNQFIDRGFRRDFLLVDEITAELASSEKATYEKLIRVLAHEVNNTVAATGSVLESLLFYTSQLASEDSADFCTAITAVKKRNGNLGEFIERFTRVVKMPEPELKPHDLAAMLDGVMYLYRQQCSELGISFTWIQRNQLPALMLDAHLMEQALLNIVKNAIEAVEAAIRAGSVLAGQPEQTYVHIALSHDAVAQTVQLSIIDSAGLLADVPHGQLFTPFFTTKKGGQGIGLMFVREVLNRHGFSHKLSSNQKGQTCFDIVMAVAR
ncbi:PAS domain-containing protein [Undibacterium sp. CY18W]|uniref:PAS domain-containing protein n=1 Tax=Undibacterium hunanense TaxID=2762292 RepID=A0ABR6ZN70_9BURK|nr:ATP-binding protein [Undibacterium hunanense]MBC3916875.1 PAS domain-containing protein [Undibacterium hunanense]